MVGCEYQSVTRCHQKGAGLWQHQRLTIYPPPKRERILAAARTEFSYYSLAEAQVARIIKDAQISRGAFYKYFTDLKDAYQSVFQAAMTAVHAPVKHAVTTPDDLDQFVTAILHSPYAAFFTVVFHGR